MDLLHTILFYFFGFWVLLIVGAVLLLVAIGYLQYRIFRKVEQRRMDYMERIIRMWKEK